MKRLFALLLALVMVLSLAACGANNEEPDTKETQANAEQQEKPTEAEETQAPAEPEVSVDDWGVTDAFSAHTEVGSTGFHINFPYYTGIPKGAGLVGDQGDGTLAFVGAELLASADAASAIDNVLPGYFDLLVTTMRLYRPSNWTDYAFEVTAQENTTINDYEMCRYEGVHTMTIDCEPMTMNFVAYATQLRGNGGFAYWMVFDQTEDQSMNEEIADYAYKMALTLQED